MERVTGIGGVFIRSAQPEQLRTWYAEHLGVEVTDWGGAVLDGDAMVNYTVRDLDAMLAQLRGAGVRVEDDVDEMEFGRFAWAYDGDSNRIELWEPRSQETSGSQESIT